MGKLAFLALLFCGFYSANSQTDTLLLKDYEQKILDNSKLKNDLQTQKNNFSDLSIAYKQDTLALQKQIRVLQKNIETEKQKVIDLDKNKVKTERDGLLKKVDSLSAVVLTLNGAISDKEAQITAVKTTGAQKAQDEKEKGKAEVWASIVNSYKDKLFDDLIKSSTKGSIARDMQLVGNNQEVKPVLNDLQIYFNAQELFKAKFDAVQIKSAQKQLSQLKRQSKLIDTLKDDVESYQEFNTVLKDTTITKLIKLDESESAGDDSKIKKLKFKKIVIILAEYIYDYYDYTKYPYLSDIVLEIIKRKHLNADADITDLLIKL